MASPQVDPQRVQLHLVATAAGALVLADRLLKESAGQSKLGDLRPFAAAVLMMGAARCFDVAMRPRN